MATFLGIYSKQNKIFPGAIELIVNDFRFNNRALVEAKFESFHFYTTKEFEHTLIADELLMSFVSGYLTFPQKGGAPNSCVEKFHSEIKKAGTSAILSTEGSFAVIHYNAAEHSLVLANDKFGTQPLFVLENEDYFMFSNEYQPLFQSRNGAEMDLDAIAEFYALGSVIGEKTFFKHIKNISPASLVEVENGLVKKHNYWIPRIVKKDKELVPTLANDVFELLMKINQEYISSGLTNLCLLSAGADSRLILATMAKEQREKLKFYTSNLSFLKPEEDKDVVGAKELAQKFHLQHLVEKVSYYENQFDSGYFETDRNIRPAFVYGGWHGGEILGGYCLKATPIQANVSFEQVDLKLKTIFSKKFRNNLTRHPFQTYIEEKNKLAAENREFLLMIHFFIRGFFTTIYGGSRGHWLQPFQLANHGLSPFWDSRFLQQILTIPMDVLKDYQFYNEVFKYCDKEFTNIASNSPLAKRADSVIPPMEMGTDQKNILPDVHHSTYVLCLANDKIWQRSMYRNRKLKKILRNEQDAISKQWLDFEVWYTMYMKMN